MASVIVDRFKYCELIKKYAYLFHAVKLSSSDAHYLCVSVMRSILVTFLITLGIATFRCTDSVPEDYWNIVFTISVHKSFVFTLSPWAHGKMDIGHRVIFPLNVKSSIRYIYIKILKKIRPTYKVNAKWIIHYYAA